MGPRRCWQLGLVLALALGCAAESVDTGIELTLLGPEDTARPARLLLSWWDEAGPLFRDRQIPTPGSDERWAVIRIATDAPGARRWAFARGVDASGAVALQAADVIEAPARGSWVKAVLRLSAAALVDTDGDGVTDGIDECPQEPTRHSGCAGGDAGTRDRPTGTPMDAGAAPDATEPGDAERPDTIAMEVRGPADATAPADAPPKAPDAASPDMQAPDAAPPCRILHAHGTAPNNAAEAPVISRLQALGCTVTSKDEAILAPADLTGMDLVVIGTTSGTSPSYGFLRGSPLPLLTLEHRSLGDLRLTSGSSGFGLSAGHTRVAVASHPIAGGQNGDVTVTDVPVSMGFGVPNASAAIVARLVNAPGHPTVFAYESGAGLYASLTAAARRAAFLFEDAAIPTLRPEAWRLFDGAVTWLLKR